MKYFLPTDEEEEGIENKNREGKRECLQPNELCGKIQEELCLFVLKEN
jgi:hypothetical protein